MSGTEAKTEIKKPDESKLMATSKLTSWADLFARKDLLYSTASYLDCSEHKSFYPTQMTIFKSFQDEKLWRQLLLNQFAPVVFPNVGDYKAQYVAATLYQKANNCLRTDLIHYHFRNLFKFLNKKGHLDKVWAQFYLGRMYMEGLGIPKDVEVGYIKLHQACVKNDYRAAQYLVENFKKDPVKIASFRMLVIKTSPSPRSDIFWCLTSAYQRGIAQVACAIGGAYKLGIGCVQNQLQASIWYRRGLAHGDLLGAKHLLNLYPAPMTLDAFTVVFDLLSRLHSLYENIRPTVAAALAFEIGELYRVGTQENRHREMHFWYEKALAQANPDASLSLGTMYLHGLGVDESIAKAQEFYEQAIALGHPDAELMIASIEGNDVDEGDLDDADDWYKRSLQRGNNRGVSVISDRTTQDGHWRQSPQNVWWVMVCALSGDVFAQQNLQLSSGEKPFYVDCALAFIAGMGLNFPRIVEPNLEKARSLIRKIDSDVMREFIAAGKKEGLFNDDYQQIFTQLTIGLEAKAEEKIDVFSPSLR
jgi:TPR repeat protein